MASTFTVAAAAQQPGPENAVENGPFSLPAGKFTKIAIDITGTTDWLNDFDRTLVIDIDQSFDNGVTWQPWMGARFPTGKFPHSGLLQMSITDGLTITRRARSTRRVEGPGPITYGLSVTVE